MKLVTGGAYQGKLEYAKQTYKMEDSWIDGRDCGLDEIIRCCGIHHFHEYVRRMMQGGGSSTDFCFQADDLTALEKQADAFAAWLYQKNPALVIVTNELGYGIVPIEKEDRLWREVTGRICTCLADRSEEVVRVVCGIGLRLK